MTPPRPPSRDDDLREPLDRAFVALRRQFEQLALAFEPWRGEHGRWEFNATYDSDDPQERNRAELVHANFELVGRVARFGEELRRDAER